MPLRRPQLTTILWRIAWLGVLLLHVPAVVRLATDLGSPKSVGWMPLILLAGSSAIFLAEILFLPLLTICSNRRRMVALLLVIALLHVGLVEDPPPVDWTEAMASTVLVLGAVLALVRVGDAIYRRPIVARERRLSNPPAGELLTLRIAPGAFFGAVPAHAPPVSYLR